MPRDAACRCASPGSNAAQRATSASANWLLGVEHRRGGAARRGSGGLVAAPCRVAAAARSVYAMPPRTASLCCSRAEHLRAGKPGLPHRATRPNSACAAAMSSTSGQWMTPMTASTLRCACRSAMRVRRRASSSFGGGGGGKGKVDYSSAQAPAQGQGLAKQATGLCPRGRPAPRDPPPGSAGAARRPSRACA